MSRHDAKLEMIIIMTTRNVMGKCQAEMPIFFPQTPADIIFFSDIQCKIVFSGWITSHEIYFFQCRKFFSSSISLQYFFSVSKSVQRVLIYFYSPITQLGLSRLC